MSKRKSKPAPSLQETYLNYKRQCRDAGKEPLDETSWQARDEVQCQWQTKYADLIRRGNAWTERLGKWQQRRKEAERLSDGKKKKALLAKQNQEKKELDQEASRQQEEEAELFKEGYQSGALTTCEPPDPLEAAILNVELRLQAGGGGIVDIKNPAFKCQTKQERWDLWLESIKARKVTPPPKTDNEALEDEAALVMDLLTEPNARANLNRTEKAVLKVLRNAAVELKQAEIMAGVSDVDGKANASRNKVHDALDRLIELELVEKVGERKGYRVTDAGIALAAKLEKGRYVILT